MGASINVFQIAAADANAFCVCCQRDQRTRSKKSDQIEERFCLTAIRRGWYCAAIKVLEQNCSTLHDSNKQLANKNALHDSMKCMHFFMQFAFVINIPWDGRTVYGEAVQSARPTFQANVFWAISFASWRKVVLPLSWLFSCSRVSGSCQQAFIIFSHPRGKICLRTYTHRSARNPLHTDSCRKLKNYQQLQIRQRISSLQCTAPPSALRVSFVWSLPLCREWQEK